MMEQTYQDLQDSIIDKIVPAIPLVPTKEQIQNAVRESFQNVVAEGKVFTLTQEEANLLCDYKIWKMSTNTVTGIFHWKVRT